MRTMNKYLSYNFIDKDPIIDEIRTAIKDSNYTLKKIESLSGVKYQTISNWLYGDTKRPQAATIRAVLRAIGYDLKIGKSNIRQVAFPAPVANLAREKIVAKASSFERKFTRDKIIAKRVSPIRKRKIGY